MLPQFSSQLLVGEDVRDNYYKVVVDFVSIQEHYTKPDIGSNSKFTYATKYCVSFFSTPIQNSVDQSVEALKRNVLPT